jgi:hypothetical protein
MRGTAAALLAAVALAGCGGGKDDDRLTLTTPKAKGTPSAEATATPASGGKQVTRAEEATIRGWADALRNGKVDRAVRYWAIPAIYSNGDQPVKLTTAEAIRAVNARDLVCGAKVVSVRRDPRDRHFVDVVFVLTERPGPGQCGTGTGHRAATAFRIENRKIAEWLRLPDPPEAGGSEADSS